MISRSIAKRLHEEYINLKEEYILSWEDFLLSKITSLEIALEKVGIDPTKYINNK